MGRLRLVTAPGFEDVLADAGLDDPAALARFVDSLTPDRSRSAGRAATALLGTRGGEIFVKRALKGGALGPAFLGRIPRFARVAGELDGTAQLLGRGAPVLAPAFAAGVRDVLGWKAVLGTLHRPGALDGARALAACGDDASTAARLGHAMGCAIRLFHDVGGSHADLAVTNLLHDPGDGSLRVIDLQGAHVGAAPDENRRRRELARLRRSIERRPELQAAAPAAWAALLAGYIEGDGEGEAGFGPGFASSLSAAATVLAASPHRSST